VVERQSSARSDVVRQAIDAVLDAEHRAQAELDACRREAEAGLARAREAASRIQLRTQERITRLHQACEAKTATRIRELKREAVGATAAMRSDSAENRVIREAAAHVAARLTGPDDGHQ
jgi:predicted transcriptional regulator